MNIKIGLVGLPNVGKTSLLVYFSSLINKKNNFLIANYPFATIEPNIGIIPLFDARLEKLGNFYQSKKITPSAVKIIDIAGLIEGASEGLGLGNKFLSHIRQVDLICHVIRCFCDEEIIHVNKKINPINDYEIIKFELVLADLQQIKKHLKKIKTRDQKTQQEKNFYNFLKFELEKGNLISNLKLSEIEKEIIKKNNFLTAKAFFILANYSGNKNELKKIEEYTKKEKILFFPLAVKLENDLIDLTQEEKNELGWKNNDLFFFGEKIKQALNLKVFFTAGSPETRSRLVGKEAKARECAGFIHSDILRNFTQLEVFNYQEWKQQKKNIIRKEKADYLVKEGDICHFFFNRGVKGAK